MRNIQRYAQILKFLCLIVIIPLIICTFILKWFWWGTATYNNIKCQVSGATSFSPIFYAPTTKDAPPLLIKLLSMAVDGISIMLFLWGIICFVILLNRYCKGELFSEHILKLYNKIGWIALAWTIYNPIKFTLLSILTTINNPIGQRIISVYFGSEDIFHIFIVGFFLIINSLMQEAYELKQEQDFTV